MATKPKKSIPSKENSTAGKDAAGLRKRMDETLANVSVDLKLRRRLIEKPEETLRELGFDPWVGRHIADQWGIGPSADCGAGTCRLTDPCGWTICGKTTNSCGEFEDKLTWRVNELAERIGARKK
jgi:hypothetical protein